MLVWGSSARGDLLSAIEIQPSAHPPRSGIAADGRRSVICWGNFVHGCHGLSWCDISCCWSGCSLTFTLGWHTAGWKIQPCTHTHNSYLWVHGGRKKLSWEGGFGLWWYFARWIETRCAEKRSTVADWVKYLIQSANFLRIWWIIIKLYNNRTIFTLKMSISKFMNRIRINTWMKNNTNPRRHFDCGERSPLITSGIGTRPGLSRGRPKPIRE